MREIKLYNYRELSAKSKKVAVANVMDRIQNGKISVGYLVDDVTFYMREQLEELGLTDLVPSWSLSHSQGDGVAFTGTISFEQYRPLLKGRLTSAESKKLNLLNALGYTPDINVVIMGHYTHERSMLFSYEDHFQLWAEDNYDGDATKFYTFLNVLMEKVEDRIREISIEFRDRGYEMLDAIFSEETARDYAENNDWVEYFEDGHIFIS